MLGSEDETTEEAPTAAEELSENVLCEAGAEGREGTAGRVNRDRISMIADGDINQASGGNGYATNTTTVVVNFEPKQEGSNHADESPLPVERKELDDFTDPLMHLPPHFDLGLDLSVCNDVLARQKVLILSCFDFDILFNAGYSITERFEGEKRLLTFKGDDADGQETDIDALLDSRKHWTPPTLIFAEATGIHGQSFVDSVIREKGWLVRTQNRLAKLNCYLLILTTPSYLTESGGIAFPHYSVPFVGPRLREKFSEQAADWVEEIQHQRDVGLWGRDDREFWERFDDFLKRGVIDEEIEKRRRARSDPKEIASFLNRDETKPLLTRGVELDNTVFFLAAFFPNLPVEDFQDLLVRLLGDRLKPLKNELTIPPEEGHEVCRDIETRPLLADEWHENYIEVCQRCRLQFWRETAISNQIHVSSTRGVVVAFDTSDLRDQACEEFLGTHYLTLVRLFAKVLEERFLFHASPAVLEGTIQLMQVMITANPQRYGSKILLALKGDPKGTAVPEQETNSGIPERIDYKLLMRRLYHVVRALLREPALREVVHQFFTELINQGRHDDLLELVRRLRFAAGFDQVYWWKQLLDRGQVGAKEKTYQEMIANLQTGGTQLQETLLEIRKWLPDSDHTGKSESARRANELLLDLFEASIVRSRSRLVGLWPPTDSLQWALCDTTLDAANRSVLDWLFHPSLDHLLQERLPRHLNKLVTWVLNTAVKKYLYADSDNLRSRWLFRLKCLPEKIDPFASTSSGVVAFQALVLADLATSLRGVKVSSVDGAMNNPLRVVAAATANLSAPVKHLLLESYWSETMNLLVEVLTAIRPLEGMEDESFRATRTRLETQYEGVAELKELFGQFVGHPFHEVEGV